MANDPEIIGKYRVLGRIGAGAMGIVYRAYHPFLKRVVAIKTMAESLSSDPLLRSRFEHEAEAVAKLEHDNIIAVHDMGEESGLLYLVMEYLDGQDLRSTISLGRTFPIESKLQIMIQVCSGLAHAHSKGVIHRDIKPSNIFLNGSGLVKVLDFGLARLESSDLTGTGEILGTPSYMSPEQLQTGKVDSRSDVFSTGVVFYELLSGKRAFEAESMRAVLLRILQHHPPSLELIDPSIPGDLSDLVRRAMIKDRDSRLPDMASMLAGLTEITQNLEQKRPHLRQEILRTCSQFDELAENYPALLEDRRSVFAKIREVMLNQPADYQQQAAAVQPAPPASLHYYALWDLKARAEREYEKSRRLANKEAETADLFPDSVQLGEQGKPVEPPTLADTILGEDSDLRPAHKAATTLTGKIAISEREEDARQIISTCLQTARECREKGDVAGCQESLCTVLELEPDNAPALALQKDIQKSIQEDEKQKRKAELAESKARQKSQKIPGRLSIAIDRFFILLLGRPLPTRVLAGGTSAVTVVAALLIYFVGMDGFLYMSAEARRARSLVYSGQYDEASPALSALLVQHAGNKSLIRLQEMANTGSEQTRLFNSALAEDDDKKAEQALDRIRLMNPADRNLGELQSRFLQRIRAPFQDDFRDLRGWLAPSTWEVLNQPANKMLIVRTGMGFVRGRRYKDFNADFNLTFGMKESASWILRASDNRNYYLITLNGPKADPPNSLQALRVVDGSRISIQPPATVGKDLSLKDDQLTISIRATGSTIRHFVASALAPEADDPKELMSFTDAMFQEGGFGFAGFDDSDFYIRSVKIWSAGPAQ